MSEVADAVRRIRANAAMILDLRDLAVARVVVSLGSGLDIVVLKDGFDLMHGEHKLANVETIADLLREVRQATAALNEPLSLLQRAAYAEQSARVIALELGGLSGPRTLSAPNGRSGFEIELRRLVRNGPVASIAVMYVQKGPGYSRSIARAKMEKFADNLRLRFGVRGAWNGLQYHINPAVMYAGEGVRPGDAIEKGDG